MKLLERTISPDVLYTSILYGSLWDVLLYTSPILFYSSDPAEDLLLNKSKIQVSAKYSLLNIENSGIVLSALKKAETDEALCISFI